MPTTKSIIARRAPLGLIAALALSACVVPRGAGKKATQSKQTNKLRQLKSQSDSLSTISKQGTEEGELQLPDSIKQTLTVDSGALLRGEINDSLSLNAPISRDSIGLDSLPQSTLPTDSSLRADSIPPKASTEGFDDIIEYKAQDSVVMLGTNMVYLFGPSTVDYKDKGIEGEYMRLNVDSNLVYAHYTLDSLGNPKAHPKFKDGDQSYEAKSMNYNFKTSKGFITGVVTQQGEGYITAERTKKSDDGCMYMEGGRYSTCSNHEHPHFYLQLTRAKVRPGKNIVAGPSYLVIAGVPLPIGLPFGFFPFSSKYSSGILMPSYGDETNRGLYLREGGYYFAINDYVDLALTGDWYSRGSWGLNARSNYRKRYRYNGAISASYLVTKTGDKDIAGTYSESKDFRISWTHSQDSKANPNQTFSASVNYSTSSYNHNSLNTLYNPDVSSQNTKSSSINYTRTFGTSPWSLSASIDATQTSSTRKVSLNSPNISVNMSRIYPFKRKKRVGSERWYEKISLSYSGQLRNSITDDEDSIFRRNIIKDWQNGINHSIPISASYKLFDYIDLTFSANYTERWYSYKNVQSYDATEQKVVTKREYGFNRVYDFSTSANLSTTVYGFFKPWKMFGNKLQMIRHRMTPSIGVSYRPDFGEDRWGYYRDLEYTDATGRLIQNRYNLYDGMMFGSASPGKSASLNFSLDNNIEAKIRTIDPTDSTETFKKVSLIDNFALSVSYNLAAKEYRLSDISARLSFKLSRSINLNLSGSFDPYIYEGYTDATGARNFRRLDKLRILNGRGIGGLRGTGTSFSYTFNNETWSKIKKIFSGKDEDKDKNKPKDTEEGNQLGPKNEQDGSLGKRAENNNARQGSLFTSEDDNQYDGDGYIVNKVPWSLSVNYGINYNRQENDFNYEKNDFNYRFVHSLMLNGSIQPTKNWSFNFSASYDFEAKKIANMTIGISRDLHCWTFTASAIPFGIYKSYNFTIGVKSSLLKDLKYDKHGYSAPNSWY